MIYSLAINRDGSLIATTSKDRKLRVIEPRSKIVISVIYKNTNNIGCFKIWCHREILIDLDDLNDNKK